MSLASLRFIQGATTGTPDVALFGSIGTAVTAESMDKSAARHVFVVLDVPPGSSVPRGLVQDSVFSTWQFTPDVGGGYQIQLTTYDASGAQSQKNLCFGVKEGDGTYFMPPFTAESASVNFAGNARGWAPYLEHWLRDYAVGLIAAQNANRFDVSLLNNFTDSTGTVAVTPLTSPMGASDVWGVECSGNLSCSSTGGGKFRFDLPATSIYEAAVDGLGNGLTTTARTRLFGTATTGFTTTSGAVCTSVTPGPVRLFLRVKGDGVNAGSITMRAACVTSPQVLTLFAGFKMWGRKLVEL